VNPCAKCAGTGRFQHETQPPTVIDGKNYYLPCGSCNGTGDGDWKPPPPLPRKEYIETRRIGAPLDEEGIDGDPMVCNACGSRWRGKPGYTCEQTLGSFTCDGDLVVPRSGMVVMVTGHRPDKLGGYNFHNPLRTWIRERLREELRWYKPSLAVSGMALGVDQDFAHVCIEEGIPFLAAIPFPRHGSTWPQESVKTYEDLLAKAAEVYYVHEEMGDTPVPRMMQDRNVWMVNRIGDDGLVFAVWNGDRKGGTANCVKYAEHVKRKIVRINPTSFGNDSI
jgi:uncharacterized phage-like protein YoqJ